MDSSSPSLSLSLSPSHPTLFTFAIYSRVYARLSQTGRRALLQRARIHDRMPKNTEYRIGGGRERTEGRGRGREGTPELPRALIHVKERPSPRSDDRFCQSALTLCRERQKGLMKRRGTLSFFLRREIGEEQEYPVLPLPRFSPRISAR